MYQLNKGKTLKDLQKLLDGYCSRSLSEIIRKSDSLEGNYKEMRGGTILLNSMYSLQKVRISTHTQIILQQ